MMRITRHLLIGATALGFALAAVACDDGDKKTADVVADTTTDVKADTTADATPDAVATGACTNTADQTIIGAASPDPAAVAETEGKNCFLSGNAEDAAFRKCTKDAVIAQTSLSDSCADCYAGSALCAKNNCLAECLGGGAPCTDCRTTNGCTPDFYTCSGLTPPPAAN